MDTVYVGLKTGSLLCFKRPNETIRRGHECQVFRDFEKKAVRDLQFIEALELLICLSAGQVTVHSSKEPFEVIAVIDKYPSITAFSGYVREVCLSSIYSLSVLTFSISERQIVRCCVDEKTNSHFEIDWERI